jgi:hypothetical protein
MDTLAVPQDRQEPSFVTSPADAGQQSHGNIDIKISDGEQRHEPESSYKILSQPETHLMEPVDEIDPDQQYPMSMASSQQMHENVDCKSGEQSRLTNVSPQTQHSEEIQGNQGPWTDAQYPMILDVSWHAAHAPLLEVF